MAKATRRPAPIGLTWARFEAVPSATERAPLTRDEIVAAAIRLIDEDGVDGFSMRRLGHELDAGATSIYWHVRNKDELIDLILDVVIGEAADEFDAAIAPGDDWRAQLAEVARALRRVLLRHHHIAPLLGERPTLGPRALDAAERVMGILLDAGFDDRRTALASGALINYAAGFAIFEARSPGGSADAPETRELAEQVNAYFASLPADRYPRMIAIAGVQINETEQFEYGLHRMLDGLEADLRAPRDLAAELPATASDDGPPGNALVRH